VHSQIKTERPIPESYSPAAWEAGADLRLTARFRLIPDRKFWWHAEANTELRSSGFAYLSSGWGEGRIELSLPLNRRRESGSATTPPYATSLK
jgi:hypothetical protein